MLQIVVTELNLPSHCSSAAGGIEPVPFSSSPLTEIVSVVDGRHPIDRDAATAKYWDEIVQDVSSGVSMFKEHEVTLMTDGSVNFGRGVIGPSERDINLGEMPSGKRSRLVTIFETAGVTGVAGIVAACALPQAAEVRSAPSASPDQRVQATRTIDNNFVAPLKSSDGNSDLTSQASEPEKTPVPVAAVANLEIPSHQNSTLSWDLASEISDDSINKTIKRDIYLASSTSATVSPSSETSTSDSNSSTTETTTTTYKLDLFKSGLYRFENPDTSACVAASQENMFNMIKANNSGGADFWWSLDTSYEKQEKLLAWDRDHDTAGNWENGTDVVGWVRGLKHHGLRYVIKRFSSYLSAMRDSARRIAITHEPVGILAETGHHAVVMTGFTSAGDPRITTDFTVTSINILDPMKGDNAVDRSFTVQGYNDFAYGMDPVNMRNNNSFDWPYDSVNNITTVQAINGYWVTVSPQY